MRGSSGVTASKHAARYARVAPRTWSRVANVRAPFSGGVLLVTGAAGDAERRVGVERPHDSLEEVLLEGDVGVELDDDLDIRVKGADARLEGRDDRCASNRGRFEGRQSWIVFANGSSRAISAAVSPVASSEPLSTISHSCGRIVCAAMLSASRRRFVASLRAGVTTEYRSGRLTSRGGRDTLARPRKRARQEGREPDLEHEESVEGVSRHRLSRAPLGDQAADAVHGDELLERGAVGEQEVGRAAFELGAKPSIDGVVEEAGFRLVDDPVGDEAARDLLERGTSSCRL